MYDWTPGMGRACSDPKLEPLYRAAASAAAAFLEQASEEGRELPEWSGGMYASPKNPTAIDMAAIIEAAISAAATTLDPVGRQRAGVITFAARSAFVVRAAGFGAPGWAAFAKILTPRRPPTVVERAIAAALADAAVLASAGSSTPFHDLDQPVIADRARIAFEAYLKAQDVALNDDRLFTYKSLAEFLHAASVDLAPPDA